MLGPTRAVIHAWSHSRSLTRFALTLAHLNTDHELLAPFMAPTAPGQGRAYYLSTTLMKYAATCASASLLYHMYVCFSWSTMARAEGSSEMEIWWAGKMLLLCLAQGVRKFFTVPLHRLFIIERHRLKWLEANRRDAGRRPKCAGCVPLAPWFAGTKYSSSS